VSGGASPGKTRKRAPSLGFEQGLYWEIAGSMGNPSRGFGDGGIGRSGGAAVSGGSGSMARLRGSREARERDRSSGQVS
jgi:hypothetical protein